MHKLYTVKSSAHRAAKKTGLTKDQYEIFEQDGQFGYSPFKDLPMMVTLGDFVAGEEEEQEPEDVIDMIEQVEEKQVKVAKEIIRTSVCEAPTKAVWVIADDMLSRNKQVTRKEILAECRKHGIADNTAKTQYQRWNKATYRG